MGSYEIRLGLGELARTMERFVEKTLLTRDRVNSGGGQANLTEAVFAVAESIEGLAEAVRDGRKSE